MPELDPIEQRIVADVDGRLEEGFALLERAVRIASATENHAGVRAVADLFGESLSQLGFEREWIALPPGTNRAGHLVARRRGSRGKRLLLIGHLDTVIDGRHWVREGTVARGIGAADMKGGVVVALQALAALNAAGELDDRTITVFLSGDEESAGRPLAVSRRALIDEGERSDIALAFESAWGETGTIARRGVVPWRLDVRGVPGHSSLLNAPTIGSGAILEAARIIDTIQREIRAEYLTINPGVIAGGSEVKADASRSELVARGKANVVASAVRVEGDLRFISEEQRLRAMASIRTIVAENLPRTSAEITFDEGFPAMFPSIGNLELLRLYDQASRDLGFGEVPSLDAASRGAGDISFVAHSVAALDGLGPKGAREHSPDELVYLDSFAPQIKRAAVLMKRLG